MTKKEQKLLWIFLLLLGVGLIIKGIPMAVTSYQASVDEIQQFKDKRSRLKRLLGRQNYWLQEYKKTQQEESRLVNQLFIGASSELIAAYVQGKLKELAKQSKITPDSMSISELKQADNWLLIQQKMSFKASQEQLFKLLHLIKKSKPKLIVAELKIHSYGKKLRCEIEVIGFSRSVAPKEK